MEDVQLLNRREFIKLCGAFIFYSIFQEGCSTESKKIIILHTNDQHSRIESFPKNHPKYPGTAGFARRSFIIKKIREENKYTLLFDSGDFFQGTPYFNIFAGEVEIMGMNEMGYSAVTLGNHEFDWGLDSLANALSKAKFSVVSTNYDFSHPILKNIVKKYEIFDLNGFRIGTIGAGISPKNLIPPHLFGNTKYIEPLPLLDEYAHKLKKENKCDIVVCLSHLGLQYENKEQISDVLLAKLSSYIDIIIGGHTHTFLEKPLWIKNKQNKKVLVTQAGWGGIQLGKIDIFINKTPHKENKVAHKSSNHYTIIASHVSI